MRCFLTYLTYKGQCVEGGHMAWIDANEAVKFARVMGYSIDIRCCESDTVMCAVQAGIALGVYRGIAAMGEGEGMGSQR